MKITIDKVLELLDLYEFELIHNNDNTLSLYDLQGGNLGNIQSEKFNTLNELLDRLDNYHYDYLVADLEEITDYDYENWRDLVDFLKTTELYNEYKWDIDMLDMVCSEEVL